MYYEVFKILLIILVMELIFVYIFIYPPTDIEAKLSISVQIIVVKVFATIVIVASLFGFYSFFNDSISYLKEGEKYLQKTECIVESITTFTIFSFLKKNIVCNEKRYISYFTFNSYYKKEKFIFTYLPKSNVLIDAQLISSPYEKRIINKGKK